MNLHAPMGDGGMRLKPFGEQYRVTWTGHVRGTLSFSTLAGEWKVVLNRAG